MPQPWVACSVKHGSSEEWGCSSFSSLLFPHPLRRHGQAAAITRTPRLRGCACWWSVRGWLQTEESRAGAPSPHQCKAPTELQWDENLPGGKSPIQAIKPHCRSLRSARTTMRRRAVATRVGLESWLQPLLPQIGRSSP